MMDLYTTPVEYIDGRNFPGANKLLLGLTGYRGTLNFTTALIAIYNATFPLGQWLTDGLLVSSITNPVAPMPDVVHFISYIVVVSFIL